MAIPDGYPFSALLRQFRARAHLSQRALAERAGLHRKTIVAWEQGMYLPKSRPSLQSLAEALGLSASEDEALQRAGSFPQTALPFDGAADRALAARSRMWQVPFARPPFFTGREVLLEHLEQTLHPAPPATRPAIVALTGLGGVGKTTLALEYAYRARNAYQAVLWAGAEGRATLMTAVLAFAATLGLPEQREAEQQQVLDAVRRWLRLHAGWLLILDNVQDLELLGEVLPPDHAGQVLLTTQLRATGAVEPRLVVEPLTAEEGALLLLRRAKLLGFAGGLNEVSPAERATAGQLAEHLGGLPLALDQAGAYLEETGCRLMDYQALYQRHQAALLARRGGASVHPEPVTTTFALAFAQVEASSPAAADLLRLCAYLAPEAIPEELFTEGGVDLPTTLQPLATDELGWQETCAVARRSSLLARQRETQTLSLHRLVQVVLREALGAAQRAWAERVVRVIHRAFPQQVEYATWERCQRLLPHALCGAELAAQWEFTFPEAAQLLTQTGDYLRQRGVYGQAQPLLEWALALREQTLAPTHPAVAESLNTLAQLRYDQEQYDQAQSLLERALAIREQALGPAHPAVAETLNDLAQLCREEGRCDQARSLFERALAIDEEALGLAHPKVATCLGNLAGLYRKQGQFAQALPLYLRALAIDEQALGPAHPNVAISLNNLAAFYREQEQYDQALPLLERALAIGEQTLRPDHPNVAPGLINLAAIYQAQGQYDQAVPLFERALAIRERALGPNHPAVARCLEQYATLLLAMQQPAQAVEMEARARAIFLSRHSPV